MKYNPQIHHRHSLRLPAWDYSSNGYYFITINTYKKECLFGEIVEGAMRRNAVGEMAQKCWVGIPEHFPGIGLDYFVVMPNHLHGIIVLTEGRGGLKGGRAGKGRGDLARTHDTTQCVRTGACHAPFSYPPKKP
jgi:REP element-mobilizing transposase RayT